MTVAAGSVEDRREPGAVGAAGTLYVRYGKRCLDVVASAAGLIALSPFLIACAVLVRLSSSGPVFYKQIRVGRDGVPFSMLKFRSMRASE